MSLSLIGTFGWASCGNVLHLISYSPLSRTRFNPRSCCPRSCTRSTETIGGLTRPTTSARLPTIGYVRRLLLFWMRSESGCLQNDRRIFSDELDNNSVPGVLRQFLLTEAGDFPEIVHNQPCPGVLVVVTVLIGGYPLNLPSTDPLLILGLRVHPRMVHDFLSHVSPATDPHSHPMELAGIGSPEILREVRMEPAMFTSWVRGLRVRMALPGLGVIGIARILQGLDIVATAPDPPRKNPNHLETSTRPVLAAVVRRVVRSLFATSGGRMVVASMATSASSPTTPTDHQIRQAICMLRGEPWTTLRGCPQLA